MAAALNSQAAVRLRLLLSALKPGIHFSRPGSLAAFGTSVTSAKVAVNGVHLHYQRTGRGKHAVLLLPGMLGCGETDFGPQIKGLNKERFTVVAWDPRGYGRSRPPDRDFPVDFFERDAQDAVDLMKVGIRDVSKWSEKTRKPLEALYGFDYFAKTCEKWVDSIGQFRHLPDGNICRHLLPLVQCPTLIVHGEKDPLVPRFHADFIHKHVRGSRLHLIAEGKHNLHLRFADEFNTLVEEFLQ
ncbi:PREDICTED: valacyclovir hydrolase [Condylura cristata]|uniref:valacyclovir hydrolase n=1 Tax=Condylura cristata TaxID=143302 RepID=UPI0003345E10|nr:PREDICTED: valacyclovir hydrolase [Condylura cristata]